MKRRLQSFVAILLGLVFVYAGSLKALDRSTFFHDIRLYHLVSDDIAWYMAHYLPWIEIIAGLGLAWKYTRSSSSIIIATLLVVFMVAMFSAWARGFNITCGCFGEAAGGASYGWILTRDIILLVVAIYLLATSRLKNPASI